jgi:hypothetical protein
MCHEITEIHDFCRHGLSRLSRCERRKDPGADQDAGPAESVPHAVLMTEVLKDSACPRCAAQGVVAVAAERPAPAASESDDPTERCCERDAAGDITRVWHLGLPYAMRRGLRDSLAALAHIDDGLIIAHPAFARGAYHLESLQHSTYAIGMQQHERIVELSRWFAANTDESLALVDGLLALIAECRENKWWMKLAFARGPEFCRWW